MPNSNDDVIKFVKKYKDIQSNAKLYYGKICESVSDKIYIMFNIDINNYNLSLSANSLKHILKKHGNNFDEIKRGQIAIKEEEFMLIPKIISNFDNIIDSGISKQGKKIITFVKNMDYIYNLVTCISDKNHNLEIKTMYKKRNSATASNE